MRKTLKNEFIINRLANVSCSSRENAKQIDEGRHTFSSDAVAQTLIDKANARAQLAEQLLREIIGLANGSDQFLNLYRNDLLEEDERELIARFS